MDFGLSPSQVLLRDSVADHLRSRASLDSVRDVFNSETGWSSEIYRELGDQGILGVMIPEEFGGTQAGLLEAAVVAQELGRAATPVPFHTAAVLAPLVFQECGSTAQRREWLPPICDGQRHVAVALDGALSQSSDGSLSGEACWVANAQHADALLLRCKRNVVLIDMSDSGVAIKPVANIDDTRRLSQVTLQDVPTAGQTWLPEPLTEVAEQRLRAAVQVTLAADLLGACQRSISLAVDYAKQREQFDRVIASFQAVKHICAEMIAAVDPIQSLLWYAAYSWDRREVDAPWLAALLKAHSADVGDDVATMATQVHGGIGFTWECDMHIFYKRIAYNRQLFGVPEDLRMAAAALQFPSLVNQT